MTGRVEEIEIGNIKEVSEPGGTAVAKDTAALSAVLRDGMSFDAQDKTRTKRT